jgi:hypothetical protein
MGTSEENARRLEVVEAKVDRGLVSGQKTRVLCARLDERTKGFCDRLDDLSADVKALLKHETRRRTREKALAGVASFLGAVIAWIAERFTTRA